MDGLQHAEESTEERDHTGGGDDDCGVNDYPNHERYYAWFTAISYTPT